MRRDNGLAHRMKSEMEDWEHIGPVIQPFSQRKMLHEKKKCVVEQAKRVEKIGEMIDDEVYPTLYELDYSLANRTGKPLEYVMYSTVAPDSFFSSFFKFYLYHMEQEEAVDEWIKDALLEVQRYEINRLLDCCYRQMKTHIEVKLWLENAPYNKEVFDDMSVLAEKHLESVEYKIKEYFDVVIGKVLNDCRKFFQETMVNAMVYMEDNIQTKLSDSFVKTDWHSKRLRSDAHTRNTKRVRRVKRKNGHQGMTKAGRRREMRSY